jgi:putative transposase
MQMIADGSHKIEKSSQQSGKKRFFPLQKVNGEVRDSPFTEEQIIGILREQEAGAKTADVCRKHGISSATFYKWKAKFGGLDVSDAKRLRSLEDENAELKRLLAEAMLDNAMLKDIATKNGDRRRARGRRSPLSRV